MRRIGILIRIIPKEEFVLTRYHPHLVKPFRNECIHPYLYSFFLLVISRKSFSNSSVTLFILTLSFLTGYIYARLSRDLYARRRAYARYTNFMLIFDSLSRVYEHHYFRLLDFISTFDHTYYLWRLRT